AAGALARRARRLDDRAVAAAARARLLEREQALRRRDDAGAVALGAALRRGAGRGAGAVTRVTRKLELDRHRRLEALERVLERDAHVHLDVRPALAALRPLLLAAAAEESAEDVAQVEVTEVEVRRPVPGAAVLLAEAVVLLALVRVRQHVVGVLHLLEA